MDSIETTETEQQSMTQKELEFLEILDRAASDRFVLHVMHCETCRTRLGVAMQLTGAARDMAFWSMGFKFCVDQVSLGELTVHVEGAPGVGNN